MNKNLLYLFFSALVLGFLNYAIYEKEALLDNGEIVYLELAPVDPRSLMQGDFMQLRFAASNLRMSNSDRANLPARGLLEVCLDNHNVGTRIDQESSCQDNQKTKSFRYIYVTSASPFRLFDFTRPGIKIVPDTFFFQEGNASLYAAARYGVFMFGKGGDYLLVGLADENRTIIKPPEE